MTKIQPQSRRLSARRLLLLGLCAGAGALPTWAAAQEHAAAAGAWPVQIAAADRTTAAVAAAAAPPAAAVAATTASATATGADAAPDAAGLSSELVVTARRREETAQNVPIALTVLTGRRIEATGAFNLPQIAEQVPSIQVFSLNARNTNVNIRGLGTNLALANDGLESGVGFYLDQVYYSRPGTTMFDLVDLDRFEILRGPQGTLFGKNTTAGALNVTTRLPSFTPEGWMEATAGNYDFYQVRGSVSGPIVDGKLAGRLSFSGTTRSGFLDNVRTGQDVNNYRDGAIKGQLLFTPTENLSFRLIADYANQQALCCVQVTGRVVTTRADGTPLPKNFFTIANTLGYTPLPIDPFARETDIDSEAHALQRAAGVSLQADWTLPIGTITSISAYRYWHWDPANDADYTGLPILLKAYNADRQSQFSQELRLASKDDQPITYTGGLYYFQEDVTARGQTVYGADASYWLLGASVPSNLLDGLGTNLLAHYHTRSYASFGEATWHIVPKLSLTGGLRFTHEVKWGDFYQSAQGGLDISAYPDAAYAALQGLKNAFAAGGLSANPANRVPTPVSYAISRDDGTNSVLTGDANLSYQASDNLLLYATYAHGSKSGGLNLSAAHAPLVLPEVVDNYELGLKSSWFERRLTLNLAAYWTEDHQYQTSIYDTERLLQYIGNIPHVRSRGIEADVNATPSEYVSFYSALAYDDATLVDYKEGTCGLEYVGLKTFCDLSGKAVPGVSKWAASAGGEVHRNVSEGLQGYLAGDASYRSWQYTQASDSIYSKVPGVFLLNMRLGIRHGGLDAFVFAKNILDKNYILGWSVVTGNTGLEAAVLGDPRTFGVTVRASF